MRTEYQEPKLPKPPNLFHSSVMLSNLGCQSKEDDNRLGELPVLVPVKSCVLFLVRALLSQNSSGFSSIVTLENKQGKQL